MATEVEMKARVSSFDEIDRRLAAICTFERSYEKRDIYLRGPGGRVEDSWAHWLTARLATRPGNGGTTSPESSKAARRAPTQDFRIRIDDGSAMCTFKDRTLSNGMEVNREVEFALTDVEAFLELVKRLGCRLFSCKVKDGKRYHHDRCDGTTLTVELSLIEGLGVFLEVERVVDDSERAEAPGNEQAPHDPHVGGERHAARGRHADGGPPAPRDRNPSARPGEATERAKADIRAFFRLAGVPTDAVEDTPYSKLMADAGVDHRDRIPELAGFSTADPPTE